MKEVRSCGVLIVRGNPIDSFLLMKHADRWDLPKGHVDAGETDLQCALRELVEETGISAADIEVDAKFRWETYYEVRYKRDNEPSRKTLVIYLARLLRDVPIVVTEHLGFQWQAWNPPHQIQEQTIDPLLRSVEDYFKRNAA